MKSHFTHLQQYDEYHCVHLARIGRHSEIKPAETTGRVGSGRMETYGIFLFTDTKRSFR